MPLYPGGPRRSGTPRLTASLLVACLALLAGGPRVNAAATVPPEPGSRLLPGTTYGAIVADLDGDGVRELIRLTPLERDPSKLAVETWREARNGSWAATGQAALRRGASVDEQLSGIPKPDADRTLPLLVNDRARLVTWHDGTRARVLAVVIGAQAVGGAPPCCLTAWDVTEGTAGAPVLRKLVDTQRGGDEVFAVDLDGDGVDELVVREPSTEARDATPVSVLRWTGSRFERLTAQVGSGLVGVGALSILGDSDGLPGAEMALVGGVPTDQGVDARLTRISLRGGRVHVEQMPVTSFGAAMTVDGGTAEGGPIIVFGDDQDFLTAISWPADSAPTVLKSTTRQGRPVAMLGTGGGARIVVRRSRPEVVDILGADLGTVSARGATASTAAAPFVASPLRPYIGPWPDPLPDGATGFIFQGTLIVAASGEPPDSTPMAVLPGMAPVGVLGADGAWTALLQVAAANLPEAWTALVQAAADLPDRRGGQLPSLAAASLTLARTDVVLAPESDDGRLPAQVEGGVVDPHDATGRTLLSGGTAISAMVGAPEGSLVEVAAGDPGRLAVLGGNVPATVEGGVPLYRVPIDVPPASGAHVQLTALVYLATPAGHGYAASWRLIVQRDAPALAAETSMFSLGLSASVSGRTDAGATVTVTVDGSQAAVSASGAFEASVPAGLFPRDVRVEATNLVGKRATLVLSVVGPIDYRRLPWIPIVVALTLLIGAVLFVRAPRPNRSPSAHADGDGNFEELEPD
jgi:hypothetical protein